MNASELATTLEKHDFFDMAIIYHGFTDYMRDYEVVVFWPASPGGGASLTKRFLFRHCVHADVVTTLSPDTWSKSLDERLIVHDTEVDLDGYAWGVKWQNAYPGLTVVTESPDADSWSAGVGIPFHEVNIETNCQIFRLIFAELEVLDAPTGYAPFTVEPPPPIAPKVELPPPDPSRMRWT